MNVITLIEPTVEPVTLTQVYSHLRLTPDPDSPLSHPDDAMLTRQIASARRDCENKTRRSFVRQQLRLILDSRSEHWPWHPHTGRLVGPGRFPWSFHHHRSIELKRPPVMEVLSVSYWDADNVLTEIDPTDYFVTDDEPARLQFITSFQIPTVYRRPDALRIDYWAGYPTEGSPADDFTSRVPEPIKSAILLGIELQYDAIAPDQRVRMEMAQDNLLSPYVVQLAI